MTRILGHIHTYNDADIIDQTLGALLDQSLPLAEIIIVDNASTDGTLERSFPDRVTVIQHAENLGTSGTLVTGLRYALENDYDWIWVFDADSLVGPDALKTLIDRYESFSPALQEEVRFLACLPVTRPDDTPLHGALLTRHGIELAKPVSDERYYQCHFTIWSGCLYRLAAIREIGLPCADYVLDWGEFQYGYQVLKAGYRGYIDRDSLLQHNIRGMPSLEPTDGWHNFSGFRSYEFPEIRCYYMSRNMIYFAFYEIEENKLPVIRANLLRVLRLTVNFVLRPRNHGNQIKACLRGIWDGFNRRLSARF